MTPSLSVVFPSYADDFAVATAQSIRDTAGDKVEIVCVDDAAQDAPVSFSALLNVRVISPRQRIGSPAARHLGALMATGTHILQCDSHCTFAPGWYEALIEKAFLPDRTKTVHCASMIGLDRDHATLENNNGTYWGADFKFCKDGKSIDAVWAGEKPGDDYELSAVMGSAYAYSRFWYLRLTPHRYLRAWGLEEQSLSLKCWLAGGEIRLLKQCKVGHRFRTAKDRVPYVIRHSDLHYNTLFIMLTCIPEQYHQQIIRAMGKQDVQWHKAMAMIKEDFHIIEIERVSNELLFTKTFEWFCEKFGL